MRKLRNSVPVAIAIAAAGLVLGAPQASAEIGSQIIIAGGGLSNGHGTGCNYLVVANSVSTAAMDVYDNGVWIGGSPESPSQKTRMVNWTPQTRGQHEILLKQNDDIKRIVLQVGTGINAGSSCLVI